MVQFDDTLSNKKIADLHDKEEERRIKDSANQAGYNYVDLQDVLINPEALAAIKQHRALNAEMVGYDLKKNTLYVAVKDPHNPKTQEILKELHSRRYEVLVSICSLASLEHAWERYADIVSTTAAPRGVLEVSAEDIERLSKEIKTVGDIVKNLQKIRSGGNTRRISETLELIFAAGISLGASDIHIEPEKSGVRLRFRFDGVLHDITLLDNYIYQRLVSRLKLLSGMVLNTRSEPQDGRFTFDLVSRRVEVRSSVIPGANGESVVMRLLDPSLSSFNLNQINMNPHMEKIILEEIKKPNGLIITTGPTGSGKTTAIYTLLKEAHNEGVKIITLENPVEYRIDGMVQTQIDDTYTFATGLRAILRQDPDIIMVGEIRDREVAETAIHAAQTGHLVFTTLHTNSAVAGFARLIDLGVDPRIMGSSINIIMGQRLIRSLCPDCREEYEASEDERKLIEHVMKTHPHPSEIPSPLKLFRAKGCEKCGNSGYKGRLGIFEGIVMDEAVEEVVIRDPREHIILEAAKKQKIPSMVEDGIDKILSGISSLEELERVIELPNLRIMEMEAETLPTSEQSEEEGDKEFFDHIVKD